MSKPQPKPYAVHAPDGTVRERFETYDEAQVFASVEAEPFFFSGPDLSLETPADVARFLKEGA